VNLGSLWCTNLGCDVDARRVDKEHRISTAFILILQVTTAAATAMQIERKPTKFHPIWSSRLSKLEQKQRPVDDGKFRIYAFSLRGFFFF
jgi:hypothetical protein